MDNKIICLINRTKSIKQNFNQTKEAAKFRYRGLLPGCCGRKDAAFSCGIIINYK